MDNGVCYHYPGDGVTRTFTGAKDYCASKDNGWPVTIRNKMELDGIMQMLQLSKALFI